MRQSNWQLNFITDEFKVGILRLTILRTGFNAGSRAVLTLPVLTLLGVTACGGGSSTLPASEPAAAAAQEQLAAATSQTAPELTAEATPSTAPAGSDVSEQQSVAVTSSQPVPNQAVLANAAEVRCLADPDVFNETMLELINAARIEARMCGDTSHDAVPTLTWNNQLSQAALVHARDMAANNFFSHFGSDGLDVANRVDAVKYPWRAVGENIAAGQEDHSEVHQSWVESPGHCRNIMNELFTEVGAACVVDSDSDFETYWVVVYGDSQ